jgi:uncharacterized protein
MYWILCYELVEGYLQHRGPLRDEHLTLARAAHARGELALAGAAGDPPEAGVLVWQTTDRSVIEAFADADPYVRHGLVRNWRILPWQVVIGASA